LNAQRVAIASNIDCPRQPCKKTSKRPNVGNGAEVEIRKVENQVIAGGSPASGEWRKKRLTRTPPGRQ
jgi:hypothetical protein